MGTIIFKPKKYINNDSAVSITEITIADLKLIFTHDIIICIANKNTPTHSAKTKK